MESRDMNVRINKEKSIGKVLYIVEGNKTEALILYYIFCKIYDYQFESILRGKGYHKYNSKENIMSQVFVINTEESNIKTIDKDNDFLNNLYITLFEQYDFNVDNAAIYYLFDRDYQSNTDVLFINKMISTLGNARDNGGYDRQWKYPKIYHMHDYMELIFEMLMKTAPEEIQCYHWGDMDYGGIQIFLYNEKNIFPNLIPWKMDVPSYKAALEKEKGIKLCSKKQKKLEALNAGKLEVLKQCILENKMEIEQEMLI